MAMLDPLHSALTEPRNDKTIYDDSEKHRETANGAWTKARADRLRLYFETGTGRKLREMSWWDVKVACDRERTSETQQHSKAPRRR